MRSSHCYKRGRDPTIILCMLHIVFKLLLCVWFVQSMCRLAKGSGLGLNVLFFFFPRNIVKIKMTNNVNIVATYDFTNYISI